MRKIIIFGIGQIAELAHFYFTHDSDYTVVAFTVDNQYITDNLYKNLPIIDFETIDQFFSVSEHEMFIAVSYTQLNKIREQKYYVAKTKGYTLANYISSKATVWSGLKTGDNCFILEDNTIQPFVNIGNNVTLWSGNHIGHHSTIHDHAFISSHVVISGGSVIGKNTFLGVNATIRNSICIGENNIIGMGTVINKNTDDYSVYKSLHSIPTTLTSDQISI